MSWALNRFEPEADKGAFPYFRSTYRRRDLLALTTQQG
jgi:hypothetical protein